MYRHWMNLGEGYMEPLCTIFASSCESIIIKNEKDKKKTHLTQF